MESALNITVLCVVVSTIVSVLVVVLMKPIRKENVIVPGKGSDYSGGINWLNLQLLRDDRDRLKKDLESLRSRFEWSTFNGVMVAAGPRHATVVQLDGEVAARKGNCEALRLFLLSRTNELQGKINSLAAKLPKDKPAKTDVQIAFEAGFHAAPADIVLGEADAQDAYADWLMTIKTKDDVNVG